MISFTMDLNSLFSKHVLNGFEIFLSSIKIQSLNVFFPEPVGNSLVKMFNTFVCDMSFEKVYS